MVDWVSNRVGEVGVPLRRGRVTFVDAPGRPSVHVEIAETPADRERGLMHRRELPRDTGMLFTWPGREEVRTMWMRNVHVPFDMVFIRRDGRVADLLADVPPMNDVYRFSPWPVAHVLEVGAGWAASRGVQAGQRAQIEVF